MLFVSLLGLACLALAWLGLLASLLLFFLCVCVCLLLCLFVFFALFGLFACLLACLSPCLIGCFRGSIRLGLKDRHRLRVPLLAGHMRHRRLHSLLASMQDFDHPQYGRDPFSCNADWPYLFFHLLALLT